MTLKDNNSIFLGAAPVPITKHRSIRVEKLIGGEWVHTGQASSEEGAIRHMEAIGGETRALKRGKVILTLNEEEVSA